MLWSNKLFARYILATLLYVLNGAYVQIVYQCVPNKDQALR